MNKNDILSSASSLVKKTGFKIKKHSPEICQAVGIVGMVGTVILACKATLKLPSRTKVLTENLEQIKRDEEYTVNNRRAIAQCYGWYALELVKLYGPSVALGVTSIASMSAATQILRNRNASLAAAYASVDAGFKAYRKNVVSRFGEEVDKQLKFSATEETIKEKEELEDGTTKTVKKKINVVDSKEFAGCSPYAKIFDQTNPYYQEDAEYNLFFIRQIEKYVNDKLRADKFVYLNEVYKLLGFQPTKAGQIVGWVYDPENPNGDNYIDFGLNDIWHQKTCDFVNGYERAVILDFNVDGNILDLMA